jgi:hypothetical protein
MSKAASSNNMNIVAKIKLLCAMALLLPTFIYLCNVYVPKTQYVMFEHDRSLWLYYIEQDIIAKPKETYGQSYWQWKEHHRLNFETLLEINTKKFVAKAKNILIDNIHLLSLQYSEHSNLIFSSSILIFFIFLTWFVFFHRRIVLFVFIILILQTIVVTLLFKQRYFYPLSHFVNIITSEPKHLASAYVTIILATILAIYTLYILIKKSGFPSLKRSLNNLFHPREQDSYKRNQLDIIRISIKHINFNIFNYINKYIKQGYYFLGIYNKNRRPKSTNNWVFSNSNKAAIIPAKDLNKHMLVVGGTGSGKTLIINLNMIYQAMLLKQPIFIASWKHDPKFIRHVAHLCDKLNTKFELMTLKKGDIAYTKRGNSQVWTSLSFNPLLHGTPFQLRDRIMCGLNMEYEGPASYYSIRSREALKVVLDLFNSYNIIPSFYRIWKTLINYSFMQAAFPDWNESFAKDCAGLISRLSDVSSFEQLNTPSSDIDLLSSAKKSSVVYFDFDSLSAPFYGPAIGKMFLMYLLWITSIRQEGDNPILVVLDEYQQAICPAIKTLTSQVRGAGLQILLSNQALSQLTSPDVGGPSFLNEVWQNTMFKVFFSLNSPEDAHLAAMASGIEPFKQYETFLQPGELSKFPFDSRELPGGRVRIDYKAHLPENVWRSLPPRVAGAFISNNPPELISVDHLFSKEQYESIIKSEPPFMKGNCHYDEQDDELENLFQKALQNNTSELKG